MNSVKSCLSTFAAKILRDWNPLFTVTCLLASDSHQDFLAVSGASIFASLRSGKHQLSWYLSGVCNDGSVSGLHVPSSEPDSNFYFIGLSALVHFESKIKVRTFKNCYHSEPRGVYGSRVSSRVSPTSLAGQQALNSDSLLDIHRVDVGSES